MARKTGLRDAMSRLSLVIVVLSVSMTGFMAIEICNTPECAEVADMMRQKMNLDADPCVDFYEYACGRFVRESEIPQGNTYLGVFSILHDGIQKVFKEIITGEPLPEDPEYLKNMRRMYTSCMDVDQIEAIGLEPYLGDEGAIKIFPTINLSWDESTFNLAELIVTYAKDQIFPLFSFAVGPDWKDSNRNVIYLRDPILGLAQNYYSLPRDDPPLIAYTTYLADIATELGAVHEIALQDAGDIFELEKALSKIMTPMVQREDYDPQYNPVKLCDLDTMYPELNIPGALRAAFATANVTLPDDERVIVQYPNYLGNLSRVLSKIPNSHIQSLFGFKFMLSKVEALTQRMRDLRITFLKEYMGTTEDDPRWKDCLTSVSDAFPMGASKQYVTRWYMEETGVNVKEMIQNVMNVFRHMLSRSAWLGQKTKDEALKKLDAMGVKIGYPKTGFEEADIERMYENYIMSEDNYAANVELGKKLHTIATLQSLHMPVDKNAWVRPPYEFRAFYNPSFNEIGFPAGYLHPPYFSLHFPDYVNYGAFGTSIGHELAHGYDYIGHQFDADGNMRHWWTFEDHRTFLEKMQCYADQYSKFKLQGTNATINGPQTAAENFDDNTGLEVSFWAYKEHVKVHGEQPMLPGFNLTQDQFFFLAFTQVWCEKLDREYMLNFITTDTHATGQYRALGALLNSHEFGHAYACLHDTPMNPVNYCDTW